MLTVNLPTKASELSDPINAIVAKFKEIVFERQFRHLLIPLLQIVFFALVQVFGMPDRDVGVVVGESSSGDDDLEATNFAADSLVVQCNEAEPQAVESGSSEKVGAMGDNLRLIGLLRDLAEAVQARNWHELAVAAAKLALLILGIAI